MSDIFFEMWKQDVEQGSSIPALLPTETIDPTLGAIVINEIPRPSKTHSFIKSVEIPEKKRKSYELLYKLLDNYERLASAGERQTAAELKEQDDFLDYVIGTVPMKLAFEKAKQIRPDKIKSVEDWRQFNHDTWFELFDKKERDRSAFEHVLLLDVKDRGGRVGIGGGHGWLFLAISDGILVPGIVDHPQKDLITNLGPKYGGSRLTQQGFMHPEIITYSFQYDYIEQSTGRKIVATKPKGGALMGVSPELQMATGSLAFLMKSSEVSKVVLGYRDDRTFFGDIKRFPAPNRKSLITNYVVFQGTRKPGTAGFERGKNKVVVESPKRASEQPSGFDSAIRILGALVNPPGDDSRHEVGEVVDIVNVTESRVDLSGSTIEGANGNRQLLVGELDAFESMRISLEEASLRNRDGSITIRDAEEDIVDSVKYLSAEAQKEEYLVVGQGLTRE